MDFREMFIPSHPLFEIVVRGSIVYLFLFGIFRFFRREGGELGVTDLLVVVLVADAVQNAMANEYKSITEGLILVLTITIWDYLINWLSFHFRFFARLSNPPPLTLIRDGVAIKRNMARELITMDELLAQLRLNGAEKVEDVKRCCIEGDGKISVSKFKDDSAGKK